MTHTPGPRSANLKHQGKIVGTWISKNGGGCNVELKTLEVLDDNTIGTIAIINCESSPPSKEDKANARLIAAAPEMLKCLQAIVARIQGVYDDPALIEWGGLHHNSDQDILKHSKKLITKATGEKS